MDIDLPYYLFWALSSQAASGPQIWFFKSRRTRADTGVDDPVLVEYARSFFLIFVWCFCQVFKLSLIKFLLNPWCLPGSRRFYPSGQDGLRHENARIGFAADRG